MKYQLFYPNGDKDQVTSAGTTVRQSYGQHIEDSDDVETARAKAEKEIRRLPTATWQWENQSSENELGDLRVWQVLPGMSGNRSTRQKAPRLTVSAIRDHPKNGKPAFFNNIVSRFLNALDNDTLQPPHLTQDGKLQPPAFVSNSKDSDRID